ncbi:MAG: transporter substrate-binding domain-containing protein [Hyphomicrobiaceae bacterium]
MNPEIVAELAPKGVLRAGINLSNFLLVTGKAANGDPEGVSPDMAAEIARRLGVPLKLVPYQTPALLGDAVDNDEWDIGNIGAEPQRAEKIAFTAAYCEIQSTYLVPAGSKLQTIADVDQPGVRIAMADRTAYGLWLNANIRNATLLKTNDGLEASYDLFIAEKADALAGLRPKLMSEVKRLPGARIIDGQFSAVQQAVGTQKRNVKAAKWLAAFVEEAKASGFVANLIAKHKVEGLSVAPPA